MSIYLPSTGGKEPYWGPQTSHMNFCEEDYHVTSYIGEFVNTLTSLFYTYLGLTGVVTLWRHGERSLLPYLPSLSVIVLGLCSALFHMTLKYRMQLLDDNSMLLGAAIILHRLLCYSLSRTMQLVSALGLTVAVSAAIWAHIELGESTFHQVVFAGMMIASLGMTFRLIGTRVKGDGIVARERRRQMRGAGWMYLILFLSGYALWNVDNLACEQLRALRRRVPTVVGFLTQFHGWWHILTGLGVYVHTGIVECLCPVGLDREDPLTLEERLPSFAYFGIKVPKHEKANGVANGVANGTAKKRA